MMIGDLILPNGDIMEYTTGNVISREAQVTDIPWSVLSGHGVYSTAQNTSQPAVGCITGGDKVLGHLMEMLIQ